jgi:hypothetical protein
LREDDARSRKLTNPRGQKANFEEACEPKSAKMHAKGQTGWCAAPKLLAEAQKQGLTPISMAEFWMGKPVGNNQDKDLVPSCECCRSFLGFTLCGLEEAQSAKVSQLTTS